MVRWRQQVKGVTLLRAILGDDHDKDTVRGFAVLTGDEDEQTVSDALYELTAMSTVDSPPARFQPGLWSPFLRSFLLWSYYTETSTVRRWASTLENL